MLLALIELRDAIALLTLIVLSYHQKQKTLNSLPREISNQFIVTDFYVKNEKDIWNTH